MVIQSILEHSYSGLEDKLVQQKSEIYYSILQIKKENIEYKDVFQSIYIDVKCFVINYINSVEQKDFGYDFIDINKIINSIEVEDSANARFELYSFAIRLLKSMNHDELVEPLLKRRILSNFDLTISGKGVFNKIKALFIISTYNFFSIFMSLLLISLIGLLLEQDSMINCLGIFEFRYESFSNVKLLNQFLNIVAKPLGLAENFKIIPLNVFAVILLIIFKCLYLAIVVNFMFSKIKDNLIR